MTGSAYFIDKILLSAKGYFISADASRAFVGQVDVIQETACTVTNKNWCGQKEKSSYY